VSLLDCRIRWLHFTNDLVLPTSSERGLQLALYRRNYASSYTSFSVQCNRKYTLQVESYLRMVFKGNGRRNKENASRIPVLCKLQFCANIIFLWGESWIVWTPQSCQFLNWPLFRSSQMVMNPVWWINEFYFKYKRLFEIFAKISRCATLQQSAQMWKL